MSHDYVAWNGQTYTGPPPEGWRQDSIGRWWPPGYSPAAAQPPRGNRGFWIMCGLITAVVFLLGLSQAAVSPPSTPTIESTARLLSSEERAANAITSGLDDHCPGWDTKPNGALRIPAFDVDCTLATAVLLLEFGFTDDDIDRASRGETVRSQGVTLEVETRSDHLVTVLRPE